MWIIKTLSNFLKSNNTEVSLSSAQPKLKHEVKDESIPVTALGLQMAVQKSMRESDRIYKMGQKQLLNYLKSKINPIIDSIPQEHWSTFYRKRNNFTIKDDYGDIDDTRWVLEFKKYFDTKLRNKLNLSRHDEIAISCYINLINDVSIDDGEFYITLGFVNNKLDNCIIKCENELPIRPSNPYEYEQFCADILRSNGWSAFATKASGDQGADIKAEKGGIVVILQCKLYSQPVGNKAVQEVSASLSYYGADYGAVVSNMEYTRSAKELAKSNNILLLNDLNLKYLDICDFVKK
jgi:restriction system protein